MTLCCPGRGPDTLVKKKRVANATLFPIQILVISVIVVKLVRTVILTNSRPPKRMVAKLKAPLHEWSFFIVVTT